MEDELTSKIKGILAKEILEECDVVCLIVKIRKLLFRLNFSSNYRILKSYCDWTLHEKISHNKTCQAILGEVEKRYRGGKISNNLPDLSLGINFYGLHEFRKELNSFLNHLGIQYNLNDEKKWINFRKLFFDNLSDCPIESSSRDSLIENFIFLKTSADGSINFKVKFTDNPITYNGSVFELN